MPRLVARDRVDINENLIVAIQILRASDVVFLRLGAVVQDPLHTRTNLLGRDLLLASAVEENSRSEVATGPGPRTGEPLSVEEGVLLAVLR